MAKILRSGRIVINLDKIVAIEKDPTAEFLTFFSEMNDNFFYDRDNDITDDEKKEDPNYHNRGYAHLIFPENPKNQHLIFNKIVEFWAKSEDSFLDITNLEDPDYEDGA